jgi:hypothetical protein
LTRNDDAASPAAPILSAPRRLMEPTSLIVSLPSDPV